MNNNLSEKNNPETNMLQDKPAKSLLKSWGKRMSEGKASIIPVYVGGNWVLQVPRGNKRILQVPVSSKKKKAWAIEIARTLALGDAFLLKFNHGWRAETKNTHYRRGRRRWRK